MASDSKRDKQVFFRLTGAEYKALQAEAERQLRSIPNMVRVIVTESLDRAKRG